MQLVRDGHAVRDGGYEDQVPRLEAFREAHPEIEIMAPPAGSAFWKAFAVGEQLSVQHNLRFLLDDLDRRLLADG